jgi:hypothetical protein
MLPLLSRNWIFYKLKPFNIFLGYTPRCTTASVRVDGQSGSKNTGNILNIFRHCNRYTSSGVSLSLSYAVILEIV